MVTVSHASTLEALIAVAFRRSVTVSDASTLEALIAVAQRRSATPLG
jgi:hypothetical protein